MKNEIFYQYSDHSSHIPLLFILESSRSEPTEKRAKLMFATRSITEREPRLTAEIYRVACDLLDAAQSVQKYVAHIRGLYAEELTDNSAWSYLIDHLDEASLRNQMDIIGCIANIGDAKEDATGWGKADAEVKQAEWRFETLLHKIKHGFYDGSNRDAAAADAAEQAGKASALTSPSRAA